MRRTSLHSVTVRCTHNLITRPHDESEAHHNVCIILSGHETDLNCFLESICIAKGLTDRCQFMTALQLAPPNEFFACLNDSTG